MRDDMSNVSVDGCVCMRACARARVCVCVCVREDENARKSAKRASERIAEWVRTSVWTREGRKTIQGIAERIACRRGLLRVGEAYCVSARLIACRLGSLRVG